MSASSISIFGPWRALKRQAAPQFWPESDNRERHESSNSSGSISDVIESQRWHHRQPSAAETPYRSEFGKIASLDYGDPELLDKFRRIYRVNRVPPRNTFGGAKSVKQSL